MQLGEPLTPEMQTFKKADRVDRAMAHLRGLICITMIDSMIPLWDDSWKNQQEDLRTLQYLMD